MTAVLPLSWHECGTLLGRQTTSIRTTGACILRDCQAPRHSESPSSTLLTRGNAPRDQLKARDARALTSPARLPPGQNSKFGEVMCPSTAEPGYRTYQMLCGLDEH